jgi:hypothetical protein
MEKKIESAVPAKGTSKTSASKSVDTSFKCIRVEVEEGKSNAYRASFTNPQNCFAEIVVPNKYDGKYVIGEKYAITFVHVK